jgi:carnitine O-acetyltransferase
MMEDSLKGRSGTFSSQALLPALPVPDLEETIERLLEWASPLLDPDTLERTGRSAREFASESGPGPILQKALKEFAARKDVANWLEPFWEWMYLSGRASLPFYSNIFYMFSPRSAAPGDPALAGHAAGLVVSALRFKKLVDTGQFPPDTEKGRPICMIQYKKMFSSARIPAKGMDRIRNPVISDNPTDPYERHIVVIRQKRFFLVDVVDPEGNAFDARSIETALQEIMDLESKDPSPAGVLTTLPRDEWAEARANLSIISGNRKILDTIERALFVLCLEERQPEGVKRISETMLTGDGRSRWFDKGMQFIVCPDGTSAINMEHTATDGSVMVRFASFVGSDDPWNEDCTTSKGKCPWRELVFDIDEEMMSIIGSAAAAFDRMKNDTETEVLVFESFGKERIKGLSVAPDALYRWPCSLHREMSGEFPGAPTRL